MRRAIATGAVDGPERRTATAKPDLTRKPTLTEGFAMLSNVRTEK
jgi:hypothetical protein